MKEKEQYFLFLLQQLLEWFLEENENRDNNFDSFTMIKVQKLLFFVSAVKNSDSDNLLNIFDKFYAMQYGPVEGEIYTFMRNTPDFVNKALYFDSQIDNVLKCKIKKSVNSLRKENTDIINYSASRLINISHKWDCWINAYSFALLQEKGAERMKNEEIIKEEYQYFK